MIISTCYSNKYENRQQYLVKEKTKKIITAAFIICAVVLAVFKYLSPGPGEEQLPGALQWFLDEICGFLENFDFKKMEIDSKNQMLIDGVLLQCEKYFFKPYYDNNYKWVLEMLKKAGIFSGVINSAKQKLIVRTKK